MSIIADYSHSIKYIGVNYIGVTLCVTLVIVKVSGHQSHILFVPFSKLSITGL